MISFWELRFFSLFQEKAPFWVSHKDSQRTLVTSLPALCHAHFCIFSSPSTAPKDSLLLLLCPQHPNLNSMCYCRCEGLRKGSAAAVTCWWGKKQPRCFFCAWFCFCPLDFVCPSNNLIKWLEMEKRSFGLSHQRECGKWMYLSYLFASVYSFLGFSWWYLVYFRESLQLSPVIVVESLQGMLLCVFPYEFSFPLCFLIFLNLISVGNPIGIPFTRCL